MTAILFALFTIAAALLTISLLTAPEGYEDETGFHYGRPHHDRA